jgi:hypothetical protein
VRNSNPSPGVREAPRRRKYSLSLWERGGVRGAPRRLRKAFSDGFLVAIKMRFFGEVSSPSPYPLPSGERGCFLNAYLNCMYPSPYEGRVRGTIAENPSLSLLLLRYIFAAAAALVDFPSMMSDQLFPSSDISYLKL